MPPMAGADPDEARSTAERLQLALSAAELGTWRYEAGSGRLTLDERASAHLGLPGPGPFTLSDVEARVHPDDAERVRAEIRASLDPRLSPGRFAHDYRVVHEDGTVCWLSVQVSVHFAGEGESRRPSFSIGTTRDVTERRLAEEALRRANLRLESVFRAFPDLFFRLRSDGTIVDFKAGRRRDLYVSPERFLGQSMQSVLPPEVGRLLDETMARAVAEGIAAVEYTLPMPGGEQAFEARLVPLGTDEMIVLVRDVTERKRAEDAIRESEAMLRESQRVANLGHYDLDVAAGTWTCSAMLEELSGIGPDYPHDVQGWAGIVHPDDRERMLAYLRDQVLGRGLPFDNEYRIRRIADGAERWVHGLGQLEPGPDGRPRRMFGVIQDVTQRRQSEERLAGLLERLELATRAGGIGVWDWNPVTDTAAWDERVHELFGIARGETVSYERWLAAIHPEDRARCSDAMRRALDDGVPYDVEFRVVLADGRERMLRAFGQVLRDAAGRPIRVTGVNLDITERRAAEAERIELERRLLHAQKLESLGVLAGGIAHDFNNLLMAVLGNLDLASRGLPPSSPALANLEQAMQATRRGTDLTRQMLAYSGKGRFLVAPVDLDQLVRENSELLRTAIPRNVKLALALAPRPALVEADPGQVQQVVMNLITNAAEAIGDRPGTIVLSTGFVECDREDLERSRLEVKPEPGEFVFLDVADSGCGMDAATLARLFDPFFTTKFTGRGLGMSAVLGIIRGHGGAIVTESAVGRGTVIRVLFPARREDDAATPRLAVRSPARDFPPRRSGSILVVDDDETVRKLVEQFVQGFGYESLAAANGEEALALLDARPEPVVCVILDLTMPGMSGVETFRELRRRRPEVPVLIASGYGEDDALQRFGDEIPDGFIQKPYRMAELQAKVLQLIAGGGPGAAAG